MGRGGVPDGEERGTQWEGEGYLTGRRGAPNGGGV